MKKELFNLNFNNYEYRKMYNALYVNSLVKENDNLLPISKELKTNYGVHKSKKHNNGELCFEGEYFIVAFELPEGLVTNHYKMEDWDLFKIPEIPKSCFVYDGHTPEDAKNRMLNHIKNMDNVFGGG